MNAKAQYFILAGVLVIILLSTVVLFSILSTTKRGIQEYPQEEAELVITNIDRELTKFAWTLLVNATQDYFEGRARIDEVRQQVVDKLRAYIAVFKEVNLPVQTDLRVVVPYPIRVGDVVIPAATLDDAVSRKSIIKIFGYSEKAVAAIAFYYTLTVDDPRIVLNNVLKQVYLKAEVLSAEPDPTTGNFTVTFHAETESGNGTTLGPSTLWVLVNESGRLTWREHTVVPEVVSLANGTYKVEVNEDVAYNFYILRIVDSRGVTLELTGIPYIRIQLRSRAASSINSYHSTYGGSSMEAYTIEMLANGTMIWNFQPLPVQTSSTILPLPPISVGNIRVNVTDPDTGETWVAPLQIEDWINPGTPYERPVEDPSNFIKTRGRLDESDKLVFLVNFTDPNTGLSDTYRNVTIWWIRDPDLLATPPIVTVNWDLSGLVNFSNGVYNVSVIVSQSLLASYAIDYSMSIYYKDYHAEISLFSFCWSWLWELVADYDAQFPAGTKIINGTQEITLTSPTTIRLPAGSYIFQKEQYPNGTWISATITPSGGVYDVTVPVARVFLQSPTTVNIDGNNAVIVGGSSIVLPPNDTIYISGWCYWWYGWRGDVIVPGGRWLPRYLPSGEPPNTMGWKLYNGTVRAILYRESDILYNTVSDYTVNGILTHNTTIIVPPGNFILYKTLLKFLQDYRIHKYFSVLTLISGTSSDEGAAYRLKYWAFYEISSSNYHDGAYSDGSPATHVAPSNNSLWDVDRFISQYRNETPGYDPILFGEVFNGTELTFSLSNVSIVSDSSTLSNIVDTIWIWTTADYYRRVAEIDKINCDSDELWQLSVNSLDVVRDPDNNETYSVVTAGSSADYTLVFWVGPSSDGGGFGCESIDAYSVMFNSPPVVVAYETVSS